jgi:hypothetical protein
MSIDEQYVYSTQHKRFADQYRTMNDGGWSSRGGYNIVFSAGKVPQNSVKNSNSNLNSVVNISSTNLVNETQRRCGVGKVRKEFRHHLDGLVTFEKKGSKFGLDAVAVEYMSEKKRQEATNNINFTLYTSTAEEMFRLFQTPTRSVF